MDPCPHCGGRTDDSHLPFAERLLKTLHHPEPSRAELAIEILAERLHEPRAAIPLIELLAKSGDASILRQAVRGLGSLGDPRAVVPLIRLLENGEVPYVVRAEAARSLGKIGGEDSLMALRHAIYDSRATVSQAAREALETKGATMRPR